MAQITTYFTSSSGGGISGSGAAGEVAFFTAATVLDSDSNLAWDDTNRRLSINGPNTVGSTLVIAGDGNTDASSSIDVRTSLTYGDIPLFKVYDNGRIDSQVLSGTGTGARSNIAFGIDSGTAITTGTGNVLIGQESGRLIGQGNNNTMVGAGAGAAITSGVGNTGVGYGAMVVSTGTSNTVIGQYSMQSMTTGSANTAVGSASLGTTDTGANNVAVGASAGRYRGFSGTDSVNPTDSIYIGSGSRSGSPFTSVSNEIVIGEGAIGLGDDSTSIGNAQCLSCTIQGDLLPSGNIFVADSKNISLGASNGTKIGTSASQKLAFWNKTPVVQPTTSITPATISHIGGTTIGANDTFNGYTLAKVVAALQQVGILA